MRPRRIDDPESKAEGLCDGVPYDTNLVNADGISIHFWMGEIPAEERAATLRSLLRTARDNRDVVDCTWSEGMPTGFWAHQDMGSAPAPKP